MTVPNISKRGVVPGRPLLLPLVDTQRFVDTPPRSRNEALASLMRRFRICEERGSGIDKVVFQVELFQLPAPPGAGAGSRYDSAREGRCT